MRTHSLRASALPAILLVLLAAASARAGDLQTFPRGSLIIPEQGTFQTGCGAISAYGLVWRLLKENRVGGAFAAGGAYYGGNYPTGPVTIYWAINGDKQSPNRCTPSTRHTPPAPITDPRWLDGCDVIITNGNTGQQPVVPVNYSLAWPASGIYPNAAVPNYNTLTAGESKPGYAVATLDNSNTVPRFTTVRYNGGPFIIDASDARRVIDFLRNSTDGNATTGILAFTGNKAASNGTNCSAYSATTAATWHYVQMHQATIEFDAPVAKRINQTPPRIALLDSGTGVSKGILTKYLTAANLNFAGSAGCPVGSTAGCTLNGSTALVQNPGEIYDQFNAILDLVTTPTYPLGLLNANDATGKARYKIFWTPHWVIGSAVGCVVSSIATDAGDAAKLAGSEQGYGSTTRSNLEKGAEDKTNTYANCAAIDAAAVAYAALVKAFGSGTPNPPTDAKQLYVYNKTRDAVLASIAAATADTDAARINALDNIAYFANQRGNGMFAECASLETYEGSFENGTEKVKKLTPSTSFFYNNTIDINGLTMDASSWNGRNCTDPDYVGTGTPSAANECAVYPNPGSPFSQMGDFNFAAVGGHVHQYWPRGAGSLSQMKPGVKRLAVSWQNYTAGSYSGPPYSYGVNNGWDFFTVGQKDNNPDKATIVYLAGHTFDSDIAGSRIVLNTLLNLGSNPVLSDRATTAPVAFDDVNGSLAAGTRALLVTSTYKAVNGTLLPGNLDFDRAVGSRWMFPFVKGDVRAHSIVGGTALANGANDLNAAMVWSADASMPAPALRNLFTYVGGKATTNPTMSSGHVAPHGVLQAGWTPLKIAASEVRTPTASGDHGFAGISGCVDVLRYGRASENGADAFGLVQGSDGVCDLQQLLQYTPISPDLTIFELTHQDQLDLVANAPYAAQFASLIRGYCFANTGKADGSGTPIPEPTSAQCNDLTFKDNVARPGGFVRSTAAVVPPSPNVPDAGGHGRPTVVYAGGYDGQLHAFYLSGGAGYTGPAGSSTNYNPSATSVFSKDYAADFAAGTLPAKGTELWSFLPSSQLPFLRGNNARVDSSPVVQDVFVDLVGSGVREWHTILVASVGGTGREVFAIDITNPVRPVLLWDLVGSAYRIAGNYPLFPSAILVDDATGGTGFSYKWSQPTAAYLLPPNTDAGRAASGLYNYHDLGGSSGITVGQMRAGVNPLYAAIVSSSKGSTGESPAKGLEVFAIDVANGQKLWQWEQPYEDATRSSDNTVPPVVSLRAGSDGVRRLFAGDMEGRVWELDSVTGMNVNVARTGCTSNCAFAAFDTQGTITDPHPITSNVAIAKVPLAATGDFALYPGEVIGLFGTAGAGWVPPTVGGRLNVVLTGDAYRKDYVNGGRLIRTGTTLGRSAMISDAQDSGALQSPLNWARSFPAPEHIFGNITIAGRTAFIPATTGNLNDLMGLSPSLAGKTYELDLGAADAPVALTGFLFANFGGVAVYHEAIDSSSSRDYVLVAEIGKIRKATFTNTVATGPRSRDTSLNPDGAASVGYRLLNWMRRFLSQ